MEKIITIGNIKFYNKAHLLDIEVICIGISVKYSTSLSIKKDVDKLTNC